MSTWKVITGDCIDGMATLPAGSVRCCVTSPPYYGLRDYGTATWEGGDAACDHQGKPMATRANINRNCGTGNDVKNAEAREFYREQCGKCGARRIDQQIGLEKTPDEYVAEMVAVFREVRRVLRDDGTLWLNLGDSYTSMNRGGRDKQSDAVGARGADTPPVRHAVKWGSGGGTNFWWRLPAFGTDLKPKDLLGIPWRVAFALQADGWYLRQDIIWHKPNPMPESVRDRCTKAHEYIFLLAKSSRYYYDAEAVKENSIDPESINGRRKRNPDKFVGQAFSETRAGFSAIPDGKVYDRRNRRSVWTVTPEPFPEAHFATYPPKLIEPCILAGSAPGDTILDPFTGSGTTGAVAVKWGRRFVGCELNPEYVKMAERRIGEAANHLFAGSTAHE